MGKLIVISSGLLAIVTWFGAEYLSIYVHSPLSDFALYGCFPFFTLIFLLSLFIVRTRRSSFDPMTRIVFRVMRKAVLLGLAIFLIVLLWPRSYGTVLQPKRPGIRYWDLPTGSHIAYTLIPAKGRRKSNPLIYLEGGPGGPIGDGIVQELTPLAEDGYEVYLYDQVGCGWSDRLANIRDYTAERHKKDLEAIVQKIGAQQVVLIGQSWGAILAVLYAADEPGSVAQLILTGPGPIFPLHPGTDRLPLPDSLHLRDPYYSNRQGNERANNIRTRAMAMFARDFGIKLASDKEADDFASYLNDQVNWSTVCDTSKIKKMTPLSRVGFYAQVMTVHSLSGLPDPRPKLQNSPIPLLVMKGQCDNQKWGYAEEYLELFPHHSLVIISDAGHSIAFEQPERYLTTIRDFLKRQDK